MIPIKLMPALFLVMIIVAACGRDPASEPEVAVTEQSNDADGMSGMGRMPDMQGMPDMGGMSMSGPMMEQMQAHMQQMQSASGEQMQALLPQHRQMVANMISQFNREMQEMNRGGAEAAERDIATGDEWDATVEALREDLRQMPEMRPEELQALMPEHHLRVMRLMEMHRGMMP